MVKIQNTVAMRQSALALLKAWDEFAKQIEALSDDHPAKQHWEMIDWQEASSPTGIAEDIAMDKYNACFNWNVFFYKTGSPVSETLRYANVNRETAISFAEDMAKGRRWRLEKAERTSPIPHGAEELAKEIADRDAKHRGV